ncbi:MAG: HD domain-containing protein [bacterium]|nr:HD domain-containing protein [bacterium]
MKQGNNHITSLVDDHYIPGPHSMPRKRSDIGRGLWWLWISVSCLATMGLAVLAVIGPVDLRGTLGTIAGVSLLMFLFLIREEVSRRQNVERKQFLWMRLCDLSHIVEVVLGVRSEDDVHKLADLWLKQTLLLMEAELGALVLHGSSEEIRSTLIGLPDQDQDPDQQAWMAEAWDMIGDLPCHEPLFIFDIAKDDDYGHAEAMQRAGLRSFCIIKLGNVDHDFGFLLIGNTAPGDFREGDNKIMSFSARQMSAIFRYGRQLDKVGEKIEEMKLQNDELIYSNQLKSEFASVASHELKTPLTAIKGSVDALLSNVRTGDYDDSEEFLLMIREEADRLIEMTGKILEITSLDYSNRVMERRSVNLRHVVDSCAKAMEVHLQEKDMHLEINVPATLPKVFADPGMIRQSLINLIGNAIKFSRSGQTISVLATNAEKTIEIEVRDNGMGIPQDEQPHIFERFYQGSRTGDTHVQSTGLGLAIVKQIVEQHQGAISVWSREGEGSVFSFSLPVIAESCGLEGTLLDRQPQGEVEEFLRLSVNWITFSAKSDSTLLFLPKEDGLVDFCPSEERRYTHPGMEVAVEVLESGLPCRRSTMAAATDVSITREQRRNTIAIPLSFRGKIAGIFVTIGDEADFRHEDLLLLQGIVARIGRVLEHSWEQDDPGKVLRRAMRAVRDLLQASSNHKKTHIDAGHLAWELATNAGAGEALARDVRLATNFHDVAMAQIGAEIENEERRLRPDELEKLRQHPRMAARLLEDIQAMEEVSRIVLHHHEWFDGGGYPDELDGQNIPEGSRMLAIIDAFRSMTAPRKYKPTLELSEAARELVRFAGTQFDPHLVDLFINLLKEKNWIDSSCAVELHKQLLSTNSVNKSDTLASVVTIHADNNEEGT